jgi:hypothetical protein
LDQDEGTAARIASSSLAMPLANEAMRLARALDPWGTSCLNLAPDHQVEFSDDLACLGQRWYARSIAATVTVSDLVTKSRSIVMRRRVFWPTESAEGLLHRPFQPVVCGSPTR